MYENLRPIHSKLWTADSKLCSLKHKLAIFGGHLEYANKPNLFRETLSIDIGLWKFETTTIKTVDCRQQHKRVWSGLTSQHKSAHCPSWFTSEFARRYVLLLAVCSINWPFWQPSWKCKCPKFKSLLGIPHQIRKHETPIIKTVVCRVFTRCWRTHSLMHSLTNIMQV